MFCEAQKQITCLQHMMHQSPRKGLWVYNTPIITSATLLGNAMRDISQVEQTPPSDLFRCMCTFKGG